LRISVRELT
nr:immunoglobulin heavy chain junction region [Mus musculus]